MCHWSLYQQSCAPENLQICGTNFVPDFCFLIWCRNVKLKLSTNNWLAEYVLLYPRIQLNLFRQYTYFMIKYFSQVSVISYWFQHTYGTSSASYFFNFCHNSPLCVWYVPILVFLTKLFSCKCTYMDHIHIIDY